MSGEKNVIRGPPHEAPPITCTVGAFLHDYITQHEPETIALVSEVTGVSVTYEQFLRDSCKLGDALRNYGITTNEVAAVCSENNIYFYFPIFACLFEAIPLTPINPIYTDDEIAHALDVTEPSVVFCSSNTVKKFLNKQKYKSIKLIIVIDSVKEDGYFPMDKFIADYSRITDPFSYKPAEVDLEHIAFIMWSSGTTGLPKGVMITHKNINAKHMMLYDYKNAVVHEEKASLGVLPFFHALGLHGGLLSLMLGRKLVVMEKFDPIVYLRCIEKYKVPIVVMPPPLVNFVTKSPLAEKFDLSHLQEIIVGAGPISKDLEDEIKKKYKIKTVRQAYGLTEATIALTMMPLAETKVGSCGKVLPGTSIVIRDLETGENLGPYKTGELCAKSEQIMKGYYRNEKATRESFTVDGWLRTGDIGYYDEDGYFYIVDRLKELIKYKGFQVAPAELEKILVTHPEIKDAAVVGVPDPRDGERPMAFVVKEDKSKLTEKDIFDFLKGFVSKNKYLYGGVVFLDEIPRNTTGKILRAKVRQMAKSLKPKL